MNSGALATCARGCGISPKHVGEEFCGDHRGIGVIAHHKRRAVQREAGMAAEQLRVLV